MPVALLALLAPALAQEATATLAATAEPIPASACGALSELPLGDAPSTLLADRLRLTLPTGAQHADLAAEAASAAVAEQTGSLWFLESGEDRMGVVANETFQLAGADLEAAARAYLADLPVEGAPWNVLTLPETEAGVRTVLYWPHALIMQGDADVWALGALYGMPDGGVVHVSFRLDTTTAGHGLGCTGLAAQIARSVTPGERRLTRAAHEEALPATADRVLKVALPDDMVVLPQPGPDFQVYYLVPLTPLGAPSPSLGVYVGSYPQELEPTNLPEVEGRLLGKKGAWSASKVPAELSGGLPLRLERRLEMKHKKGEAPIFVHVFIAAGTQEELDRLRAVAEAMRWKKGQ